MKKYILTVLMVLLTLPTFISCDDMLESRSFGDLSENDFPKTEKDLKTLLAALYTGFTSNWDAMHGWSTYSRMNGWWDASESCSDEMWNNWFGEWRFGWTTAGFGHYDANFAKFRDITIATNYIDLVAQAEMDDNFKKPVIAQMKCLRAWMMWCLYDWYGPLPVVLDAKKIYAPVEPRPTETDYITWMVRDLEEAIPDLPDMTNDDKSKWGEVNKGVAYMLLMKANMNWYKYTEAEGSNVLSLANANKYADLLMGMGYQLQTDYTSIFNVERNHEVIWACTHDLSIEEGTGWYMFFMPGSIKNLTANGVTLPNGGWGGAVVRWEAYDRYPAGDKRLACLANGFSGIDQGTGAAVSYTYSTEDRLAGKPAPHAYLTNGAIPTKYLYDLAVTGVDNFDLVVMRYADVLLSKAEIVYRTSGISAALPYLKEVTDRAGITIPASATASNAAFEQYLLDERSRELLLEGWRRQDMIRFDKFISWGKAQNYTAYSHMVRFPIPEEVIQAAGKNASGENIIDQNEGY